MCKTEKTFWLFNHKMAVKQTTTSTKNKSAQPESVHHPIKMRIKRLNILSGFFEGLSYAELELGSENNKELGLHYSDKMHKLSPGYSRLSNNRAIIP